MAKLGRTGSASGNPGLGTGRRVGNTAEFRAALARILAAARERALSAAAIERRLNRGGGYLSKLRSGARDVRHEAVDALAYAADLPEAAVAALDLARRHGLGLYARDLEQLVQRIEGQIEGQPK